MIFNDAELSFYSCAMRFIEEPLDDVYDWSADLMNEQLEYKSSHRKTKKDS